MRNLFTIIVGIMLAISSLSAQDKGFAVMAFNLKTSMDAVIPNEQYGSEWAYVVEDSTMYIWSRTDSVWNRYSGTHVYTIAVASDTTTITVPVVGDFAYVDTTNVFVRSEFTWLKISGSSGSTPLVWHTSPQTHQLNNCASNETIPLNFYILDDTVINTAGITFEINSSPVAITYNQFFNDSTFALIQSNNSFTADVYSVEFSYEDWGGNTITWLDFLNVTAGRPDTVTVFDPPGQDSILVTRVCGTEISRDTISASGGAGDNLGNHIATQNLDMDGNSIEMEGGVIIGGAGTGGDLVLQSTSGIGAGDDDMIFLTGNNGGDERMRLKGTGLLGLGTSSPAAGFGLDIASSLALRIRGGTTAARPTATSGGLWYNTDGGWHQGSDGTGWFYFPRTSLAGGLFTPGSVVFAGVDGSLSADNGNLFFDDTNNFLGIGTASPSSRLHVVSGAVSAANPYGLQHTASLDNTVTSHGQLLTYTSRSGGNNFQAGIRSVLNAGYNGNNITTGLSVFNSAASTGTNMQMGTSNTTPLGNSGAAGFAAANTAGNNYGVVAEALRGSKSIGIYGRAIHTTNDAVNIGVIGLGRNAGTGSTVQIGGWFGMNSSEPTFQSAALVADNGSQTSPIFLGLDNGGTVFSIVDGGNVGIGSAAASPTARFHLPAGTATAGTSSLKIGEGVNETTPVDGAINHVADRLNFTSGTTVNVIAHLSDITDDQTASEVNITDAGGFYTGTTVEAALQEVGGNPGTNLATNDVPRWNGTALAPSGITSDGSSLVDILGEYPFIPFYGPPDAGADGYVVYYDNGEGGIILGPLSGYIPFDLSADGQFAANGFKLIMNEIAGFTIDGAAQRVIFGISNDNIAATAPQLVFSDAAGNSTWGQTGGESFFEITSGGEAVVNSNSIGLRAEWDSTNPIVTLYDTDIILPNTGISTDNTDRVAVMDSGDAIRYKETCRARLTETTPTALTADASYRHVKSLSSANLSNFTATDSTLTYTGTETILVEIQYTGSIQYDESTFGTYGTAFRVFVGASGYVESSAESIIITDAEEDWIVPVAGSLWVSLNPSDVVSLRANVTASITVNLRNLNFTVKSL